MSLARENRDRCLLNRFLDGEVDSDERLSIERRLRENHELAYRLGGLRDSRALFAESFGAVRVPQWLRLRLYARGLRP